VNPKRSHTGSVVAAVGVGVGESKSSSGTESDWARSMSPDPEQNMAAGRAGRDSMWCAATSEVVCQSSRVKRTATVFSYARLRTRRVPVRARLLSDADGGGGSVDGLLLLVVLDRAKDSRRMLAKGEGSCAGTGDEVCGSKS
jgi:hypothetical protein